MFATAVNLTGRMDEKGFITTALTGRRAFYGTAADRFLFAANNCTMIKDCTLSGITNM
jgi:hypothetical protein